MPQPPQTITPCPAGSGQRFEAVRSPAASLAETAAPEGASGTLASRANRAPDRALLPQWPPEHHPALLAIDEPQLEWQVKPATTDRGNWPPFSGCRTDDIDSHHSVLGWVDLVASGVIEPLGRGEAVSFRPPSWDTRGWPGSVSARLNSAC